jgi:hypothetical protein
MPTASCQIQEGDWFMGVLLETCRDWDRSISRPRVRPVEELPDYMRVEFPRSLREKYPIGTRFRADVKVCQKHSSGGYPKGGPYLRADRDSIVRLKDYTPSRIVMAVQKAGAFSGRAYEYILKSQPNAATVQSFEELRQIAYRIAASEVPVHEREKWERERSDLIAAYALARSRGNCEGCEKPAPFLRRNNTPYLEIHHITGLADGGADHPANVAAVCPNCHRRTTYAKDAVEFNLIVRRNVEAVEASMGLPVNN